MPYIDALDRSRYENMITDLWGTIENKCSPGDLNYLITTLCDYYISARGLNYTHINDVIGVLECAKQELYRRVAVPYENRKLNFNGDVYDAKNIV